METIRKTENPERYLYKNILMQIDEENETIIIAKNKTKKLVEYPTILFDDSFEKFADDYNEVIQKGTYDFLIGFRQFIKFYYS